ncbi:MAG: XRE family transcriptional regulator [Acidobacteria bacterium]|nr:XRE family transcriptional regulator [Acidobacteriota bacterium]
MSALVEEKTSLTDTLKKEFQDEDYRYAYDEEFSNARMATQIKVIREQRELKQTELADLAEMKQSRISALEDVNYNSWSISTLRRLARALGVRLSFGFETWGELLPEIENFGRKSLEKDEFKKDPAFKDKPVPKSPSKAAIVADTASIASVNLNRRFQPETMPTPQQVDLPFMYPKDVPQTKWKSARGTSISKLKLDTPEHTNTSRRVA